MTLNEQDQGNYGQAVKPNSEVDISGIYADKNRDEQFTVSCEASTSFQRVTTISSVSHN
jgi:hypothetical protein